MSKPWVLIDVSLLAHKARFAIDGMGLEDYPTGILFGFFEQFRSICNDPRVQSNKACFFFDSKKSFRKRVYPSYKDKRHKDRTEEEIEQISSMHDQVKLLKTIILPKMGVSLYRQTGLESDDLMADVAHQFSGNERKAILITSDGDLYQLITDSVHWFDPTRNNYLGPRQFYDKKQIGSYMWGDVKCIAGCKSDEVGGVPGVGEKTAVDFLKGTLPHHYKRYKSIVSQDGKSIIKRNHELVVLPHPKTKPVKLKKPKYDAEAFFDCCERYGIIAYLKKEQMKEWRQLFDNNYRQKIRKRGER